MPVQKVKSFFWIHEAVVLSGFSKYMLDYFEREGIFGANASVGRGRGRKRRYTYQDVVLLRALSAICQGRGKIRHLKESLQKFSSEHGPIRPGERLKQVLCVIGNELCVRTASGVARELRSGQLALSFVVDLECVTDQIAKQVFVDRKTSMFRLTDDTAARAEEERQRLWGPIKARRMRESLTRQSKLRLEEEEGRLNGPPSRASSTQRR